jgi:predicted nucleotide-binding protein
MNVSSNGSPDKSGRSRRVFVVHGRNERARLAMFGFLRALGLQPIEWSQAVAWTDEASPYIGQILDTAFDAAQAVVILMTPDEVAYLRQDFGDGPDDPQTRPATQARPNVLFEAGMAMGRDPKRSVLVELGELRPFSDVAGRHAVRISNSPERRKDMAQRLKVAGCDVDTSGDDWLRVGDFSAPAPLGGGLPVGKRVPGTSTPRGVSLDARYHDRHNSGRIEVINRGSEPVFNVNLEIPEMPGLQIRASDLPVHRLPPGKSFMVHVIRSMGDQSDYFDVTITARTADGEPIREEAFVSVVA